MAVHIKASSSYTQRALGGNGQPWLKPYGAITERRTWTGS